MPVVLEEFGLTKYFNSIIESSVVGLRKPDPALFDLGVKVLGVETDEIVVIGDSYRKDIYPSSTLGCRTVWLKKVCWEEEPIVEGHAPTATIESLAQLPDIINTL
jgi:putative hydrolase of the HAD superfamily